MDNAVLIALLSKIVDERLAGLPFHAGPRGPRGVRGQPGQDGQSFVFSEHEEQIKSWAKEFAIKFEDYTAEQIELLRGPKGSDGRDGKSFIFSEHEEQIKDWAREFALKFTDLTADDIEKIRGPRGRDGRDGSDGHSFIFEDNKDAIEGIIRGYVDGISDNLKLRFSDLTDDDISQLRGPRGRDGRDGAGFNFEDHREFFLSLKPKFSDFTDEERASLQLHFSQLTEEEKAELKLRFEDLSDEDRALIRGPRGVRGQRGKDGKDGESIIGPRGLRGLPGPVGARGIGGSNGVDGSDGRDGLDAPYVTRIDVESNRNEFYLRFEFSDGSVLKTNSAPFPKGEVYIVGGGSLKSSGDSGGGTITSNSVKLDYHLATLSAFDRVAEITHHDEGLRTQRIDTITYESAQFPDANIVSTVFYLDVGRQTQRIEKIEWVGSVFDGQSLRKNFDYTASGIKFIKTGFNYELF